MTPFFMDTIQLSEGFRATTRRTFTFNYFNFFKGNPNFQGILN